MFKPYQAEKAIPNLGYQPQGAAAEIVGQMRSFRELTTGFILPEPLHYPLEEMPHLIGQLEDIYDHERRIRRPVTHQEFITAKLADLQHEATAETFSEAVSQAKAIWRGRITKKNPPGDFFRKVSVQALEEIGDNSLANVVDLAADCFDLAVCAHTDLSSKLKVYTDCLTHYPPGANLTKIYESRLKMKNGKHILPYNVIASFIESASRDLVRLVTKSTVRQKAKIDSGYVLEGLVKAYSLIWFDIAKRGVIVRQTELADTNPVSLIAARLDNNTEEASTG